MRVSAFEFATMYMFRLYFLGCVPVIVCVCGSVTIFGYSWCVGCELGKACVSNLGV